MEMKVPKIVTEFAKEQGFDNAYYLGNYPKYGEVYVGACVEESDTGLPFFIVLKNGIPAAVPVEEVPGLMALTR